MTIGIAIANVKKDRDSDRDLGFGDRANALIINIYFLKVFIILSFDLNYTEKNIF